MVSSFPCCCPNRNRRLLLRSRLGLVRVRKSLMSLYYMGKWNAEPENIDGTICNRLI